MLNKKIGIIMRVILLAVIVFFSPVVRAEKLFETSTNATSPIWGSPSNTTVWYYAIKYTPQGNQLICSVEHKIARYINPTDGIRLRIFSGGTNPENGTLIAEPPIVYGSTMDSHTPSYEKWVLDDCINLIQGQIYYFTFDRSGSLASDGYVSGLLLYDEFTQTTFWQYIAVNGGWGQFTNRELSLRLSGPATFFSSVQNTTGSWNLRVSPTINSGVLKTLPEGWALQILNTTDDNGNNVDANGYRWYKVKDLTDGQEGWMAGRKLFDNTVYLSYDENAQADLQNKAEYQNTTLSERRDIILGAVNAYMNTNNTGGSIYNTGGGLSGNNNFEEFISDEGFPRELVLGVIAQESGGVNFDNAKCGYANDGGIGIMQITSNGYKGLGSGLRDSAKASTHCFGQSSSDYYSNTIQGIHANIKDGFRILQDKHTNTVNGLGSQTVNCLSGIILGGLTYSCEELKQVLTIWRYNGLSIFDGLGNEINYLREVANKISTSSIPDKLNTYFPGVIDSNNQTAITALANKLRTANKNKQVIKLHSPGDLSILDSSNNRTGVFNNTQTENINLSAYDLDEKGVVIFSPTDIYSYLVQGTDTGVYGLSIDFNDDNEAPVSIFTQNIPMIPDMVHKYTIDWTEVANNENGVHIDVDRDGNGTYDYGFDASPMLNDTIAPTSSISLSGIIGDNGWHKSNVAVNFSATDNATGAGVYRKYYSLNNGLTWNVYSSPFIISNEGTTQILYYSEDYVLNKESNQSLTIKIDKTNPEAEIYFDIATEQVKVIGTDNLTTPIVTQTGTYSYSIKDDSGRELKVDLDGHIDFSPITNIYQFTGEISGLQYNTDTPIIIPSNAIGYSWQGSTNPNLLQQNVHAEDQFDVSATYNSLQNNTRIVVNTPAGQISETLGGIVPIIITTENGILGFDY